MRTKFFRILVLALVGGLVAGCSNSKRGQITVNIGNFTCDEVIIAQAKGFFEKEVAPYNATTKVSTFPSGPPQIEALAAKSLDFAVVGDQPALQAVASGIPAKIISGTIDTTENVGLVARKDSGIKTVKDIKGKKIAAPAGTTAYQLLLIFLEKEGMTFDDFEFVNLGIGSITASLINGDVDGAVAFGTTFAEPPESEGIVKIQSAAGYKRNVNVLIASTTFTDKYPDITVAILRALQKAAKWRVDNYDEAIDIVSEWLGTEREVLIKSAPTLVTLLKLDQDAQNAILLSADVLYRTDTISEKLTAEKIFDLKFQEQADIETYPGWGAEKAGQLGGR